MWQLIKAFCESNSLLCLSPCIISWKVYVKQLIIADDNSLASIDHDINVIKMDLELVSEVAIQWFKDNFILF